MIGKARDAEFRHPDAVAFLESLTDEEAAKQPLFIFEHDGVVARYWREGGRSALLAVKCCFENRRWAEFLDWRTGRVAAA